MQRRTGLSFALILLGLLATPGTAPAQDYPTRPVKLVVAFPAIATWFPEKLQAESRAVKTEEVDDSANRLEEDPLKGGQDQLEQGDQPPPEADPLEEDELSSGGKK